MYPTTALHHPDHPPAGLSDKVPVCAFYSSGEKLYAFEADWKNLFDFIKMEKRDQFEVKTAHSSGVWQSANDQPWGIRFRALVMFRTDVNLEGKITITLKKGTWKNEYVLSPGRSRLISHKCVNGKHFIVQQPWCSFKG